MICIIDLYLGIISESAGGTICSCKNWIQNGCIQGLYPVFIIYPTELKFLKLPVRLKLDKENYMYYLFQVINFTEVSYLLNDSLPIFVNL